ncbi:MAG: glycine dehydrogenase subunit 2 [Calditrichaeota bacterium]|nr:MAG: glycine dehydrogenase subunit 2 [Calditrichota bacterium]
MYKKLIFELDRGEVEQNYFSELDVPEEELEDLLPPSALRREPIGLPEVAENEVIRHFIALSTLNYHVDKGIYPLGSCTMKYNPKVNEDTSALPGFAGLHPLQPEESVQGALQLMYELQELLKEIVGMRAITLQPAAGAHGELTGCLMIRKYHKVRGQARNTMLVPDSAHGTNPASVTIAGMKTLEVKSDDRGLVDLDDLKAKLGPDVAGLMLTNPSTLGIFEENILEISELVHEAGGLMYMDGANLNALLGIVRPGDLGFDVLHINLHKTFSVPHGGGGPGSGPVAVSERLKDFLPVPIVSRHEDKYFWDYEIPHSIGKMLTFWGNFAALVRAYTYIRMHGAEGLRRIAETAILNANYLLKRLEGALELPFPTRPMHEFVLSAHSLMKETGVKTLDIAKRLLDFGVHAPTIYFPLVVKEALMIEPTESESKAMLDYFATTLRHIVQEAKEDPQLLKEAPHATPVGRLNELKANKELVVRWHNK